MPGAREGGAAKKPTYCPTDDQTGDDSDRPVLKQRTVDKFYTAYAEFTAIELLGSANRPQVVFAPAETIKISVQVDIRLPIPVCEFGFTIYSLTNVVIAIGHWPLPEGLNPGRYGWDVTFQRPNLRQNEYLLSCALIREFSEATNERIVFYALWNRSLSFRVDEGRVGSAPHGLILLQMDPPSGDWLPVRSFAAK